ncbi:hypothetical protein ACP70R_006898 [Stipagrostis hirtigluma subsp. patula]
MSKEDLIRGGGSPPIAIREDEKVPEIQADFKKNGEIQAG